MVHPTFNEELLPITRKQFGSLRLNRWYRRYARHDCEQQRRQHNGPQHRRHSLKRMKGVDALSQGITSDKSFVNHKQS